MRSHCLSEDTSVMHQVRSATRVEQIAACMLQLEACLRRGALIKDWDPLARLAARKATEAGRVASEGLAPTKEPVQEPAAPVVTPQPTTPHTDSTAPGTPQTEAEEAGKQLSPQSYRLTALAHFQNLQVNDKPDPAKGKAAC